MVARMLRALVILHLVAFLIPTDCHRKKDVKLGLPSYHIYSKAELPADVQITTYLVQGQSKRFIYKSEVEESALSVTLITCTSPIRWSFESDNSTLSSHITQVMDTVYEKVATKGLYTLELLALERNTYAHVYVSTEEGGPQALQNAKFTNLRLLKRQRKKRLTVKWNPSLVDPQGTDYCLVVSAKKSYGSLCSVRRQLPEKDLIVACVGRKTHYTLTNLKQGQHYYFTLFATNNQSNFTYPYGATSAVFDNRFKPVSLKNGKSAFADLKKLDGKAVFRYKIGKNVTRPLDLFVIPCGGAVDVEVTLKDSIVIPPKRIEGFKKISIEKPLQSVLYYIKIFALNREELKKTTGVEVYATTKSPEKIPIPNMPQVLQLREYKGLRTCDSVTVGWIAAPVQRAVRYCLVAKEGKIREMDDYRMPNQCGLENRLRKSTDFTVKFCFNINSSKEQVIVRKIRQLKPGRNYIVQVTVKKRRGKTLSYDLLQVCTKPSCKNKHEQP